MIRLIDLYKILGRRLTQKLIAAKWIAPTHCDARGVAFDAQKVHRALGRLVREGLTLLPVVRKKRE